jgi:hypothetical protein
VDHVAARGCEPVKEDDGRALAKLLSAERGAVAVDVE